MNQEMHPTPNLYGQLAIYIDTRNTNVLLPLDEDQLRNLIAEQLKQIATRIRYGHEGNHSIREFGGGAKMGDWTLDLQPIMEPVSEEDHNARMLRDAHLEAQTRHVYEKGIAELREKLNETDH